MKNFNNDTRGYYRLSDMYSSQKRDGVEHEIMFGFYPDNDEEGDASEMAMRWYALGNKKTYPRLEVFDGSWQALYDMENVLYALSRKDERLITPKEFCELLDSLGFKDKSGQ